MKKFLKAVAFISAITFLPVSSIFAHSGRTNSVGGHHNTTTGRYHRHK